MVKTQKSASEDGLKGKSLTKEVAAKLSIQPKENDKVAD
jgi:hypothetical protein